MTVQWEAQCRNLAQSVQTHVHVYLCVCVSVCRTCTCQHMCWRVPFCVRGEVKRGRDGHTDPLRLSLNDFSDVSGAIFEGLTYKEAVMAKTPSCIAETRHMSMPRLSSNCDESDWMRANSHAIKFISQVHLFPLLFLRGFGLACLREHIKQNCSINISLQVPNCFPTTNVCFLHLSFLNLAKGKTHIRDYFQPRELSVRKPQKKEKKKKKKKEALC